ncbi:MAG TPA: hypothetical protein VGF69_04345 [Thermoanaerobaculia bacterium]|jgi:hypothetical protein
MAIVPSTLTMAQGYATATFAIDTEAVTQPFDVIIRAAYNGTVQRLQLTVRFAGISRCFALCLPGHRACRDSARLC